MKKRLFFILSVLIVMALIAGCAPRTEEPAPDAQNGNQGDDAETPSENNDGDGTENPVEDEKDKELGEDDADKKEDTSPEEGDMDGPMTAEGIEDGTYEGQTDKDERGNYGIVKLTVSDGEITDVEYTEYTEDDKSKSADNGYEYEPALNAFQDLPEELEEKQNIQEVDTYTGATGTTNKFKTAVSNALKKGMN